MNEIRIVNLDYLSILSSTYHNLSRLAIITNNPTIYKVIQDLPNI